MPIREAFPEAGSEYMDGESDGWEYKTIFSGTTLEQSYDMVRAFLREEGYKDVPTPATVSDLLLFKNSGRNRQMKLFADTGYIHNPVKILFSDNDRKNNKLILCLYNETAENHLLRFHGVIGGQ